MSQSHDWHDHPYARDGRKLATSVGPKGGKKLVTQTSTQVMRDTPTNRNSRCAAPVGGSDISYRSGGSGVVHSPESRGSQQRRYTRLRRDAIVKAARVDFEVRAMQEWAIFVVAK